MDYILSFLPKGLKVLGKLSGFAYTITTGTMMNQLEWNK